MELIIGWVLDVVVDKIGIQVQRLVFRKLVADVQVSGQGAGVVGLGVGHAQQAVGGPIALVFDLIDGLHVPVSVEIGAQHAHDGAFRDLKIRADAAILGGGRRVWAVAVGRSFQ